MSEPLHASPISKHLIAEIRDQFRITWDGHHGAPHWARVRHHGLYLGRQLKSIVMTHLKRCEQDFAHTSLQIIFQKRTVDGPQPATSN